MNSTENRFAEIFFADLLLPLRNANLRRGIAYLDGGQRRESYWGPIASRTGGMERLSRTTCDAAALLGLLGAYWVRRNDPNLPLLLPHLESLRQELAGVAPRADQSAQRLTDFVYPLA